MSETLFQQYGLELESEDKFKLVQSIMGCLAGTKEPKKLSLTMTSPGLNAHTPKSSPGHHSKTPSAVHQPPRLNTSLSNCNFDISDNGDSIENQPCL